MMLAVLHSLRGRRIIRILGNGVVVVVVFAGWMLIGPSQLGGPMTYALVEGNSMRPLISNGDFVIVHEQVTYQPGDIILFRQYGGYVVHRIVSGSAVAGWRVQGIDNPDVDPWTVRPDDVLGKYVWSSVRFGTFVGWVRTHRLMAMLLLASVVLVVLMPRRHLHDSRDPESNETAHQPSAMPAASAAILATLSVGTIGAAVWTLTLVFVQSGSQTQWIRGLFATVILATATYAMLRFAVARSWLS